MVTREEESWNRIWQAFHAALELPAAERYAWVRENAGLSSEETGELLALLEAHEDPENIMDRVPEVTGAIPAPGEVIDVWKLLQPLGRGGSGVVYLAERCDGSFERRVAAKIFSPLYAGFGLQESFLRERRILARLDHPGIARLQDAGTDARGRLYLIMDYIEGTPLLRYCREQQCDLRQRIELFRQICEAVAYAHRGLVVHGDLKPGNIMVQQSDAEAGAQIKLLDFGVARLIADNRQQQDGQAPVSFTPGYAAPEQWFGEPLTVACDVYSLGIIFCELLCGRHPFREHVNDRDACLQAMRDGAQPLPELLAAGRADEGSESIPYNRLPEELDWIIRCCLQFEPAARYQGLQPLLDDLRALRHHYPVRVRPPRSGYRLRKFTRRHWRGMIASGLAAVTLTAFVVMLVVEGGRTRAALAVSERHRLQIEATVAFLTDLFESSDRTRQAGQVLDANRILAQGREQLARRSDLDPATRLPLVSALAEVYGNVGRYQVALDLAREAVALAQISSAGGALPRSLLGLGRLLFEAGELDESRQVLEYALASEQADASARLAATERVELHLALGTTLQHLGDLAVAGEHFFKAEELATMSGDIPAIIEAEVLLRLGSWHWSSGDLEAARDYYARAVAAHQRLPDRHLPELARAIDAHAAALYALGSYRDAAADFQKAIAMRRQVLGGRHQLIADSLSNLGAVWYELGEDEQAERVLREALSIYREVLGERNLTMAKTFNNLGLVRLRRGDPDEAEALFRQALSIHREELGDTHLNVGGNLNNLGMVAERRRDWEQAEQYFRQALAINQKALGNDHPALGYAMTNLARIAFYRGNRDQAEQMFAEAYKLRRQKLGSEHAALASTLFWWGLANCRWGESMPALGQLAQSHRIRAARLGDDHPDTIASRGGLAVCRMMQNRRVNDGPAGELWHWQRFELHYPQDHPLRILLAGMLHAPASHGQPFQSGHQP